LDVLADLTGIDSLRSPNAAGFKTAGKEFLLGNISRAGARPNQWIEQQISGALPKVGQKDSANKTVLELLDLDNRIQRKEIELVDEIANRHERQYGYVRRSLGSDVQKELNKFAKNELKVTEERIKAIQDGEQKPKREAQIKVPEGKTRVKLPSGQKGFIPTEQLEQFMEKYDAEIVQ